MYVVFCIPSAETIHQGLGAHYTLKDAQKGKKNSVSKILSAVSQRIVIKALRPDDNLWRQASSLPFFGYAFSA
ncbi:hypothetical protein [Leclercia sp.]|uniref:hypothetical protein n=1 Tax=Leclercia sp. TaxID=1898428 RepID=UPI002FDD6932